MADWVKESNDYVENLNLFRITMRDASDEALDFANKVHDAFGIDPSEWIRFQAVFQNMATGFGIAADKASVMSKNLTQLGYDLATVFNVNYEVAMQKLQSALAGQPRPMREWGFDMSEATLKLAALRHGIEANVETMTQYEKSQIRYLQIMETARRQGVLGNFAREIHTPANAMRILNQQLLLFRRELGNMIIPILMKILPYLQAFVKVITDAARALAAFFGFELPLIDYSGLEALPPLIDDVGDGFDDATKAAKKLKSLLMGFDEINILPKDTVGAGLGAGGIGGKGGGLDIDPSIYDYDFLGDVSNKVNEIVDEIYRKVEPFVNFVKDNFDHIKDVVVAVGIGLLGWQIAKGVLNFFQWLQGVGQGGKIAIGMTLMLTGITLGATGIGNLVAGSGDVIDVIKAAIGGALALGGSLIAFGTGPVGWTIGIAAVLTMTIAGFIIGTNKRIDALIQEAIGSNGGTLITELSKAFSNLMDEIGSGFDPIIEGGQKLREHKENIDRAKQSIETLFTVIDSNAGNSADELNKVITAITGLLDETQLLRDQAYGNIVHALSNSFTDVQKTVGKATKDIVKDILLIKNEGDEKLTNAQTKIREYEKAWQQGEMSIEETSRKIVAEYEKLYGGRTMVDEVGDSFLGLVSKLDRIDWLTPTERSKALEEIGESARKARDKADQYFDAMTDSIEVLLNDIDDPAVRQRMADALYLFRDEEKDAAYKRIADNLELLFGAMQSDLTSNITEVSNKASKDWDNMEWWQKLGSSKPYYVSQAIDRFKKGTMDPVSKDVNRLLEEFGREGGTEMQDAVANILDEGFKWDPIYNHVLDFSGELSNVTTEEIDRMKQDFRQRAESMGIAIPEGMSGGVGSKLNELESSLGTQNRVVDTELSAVNRTVDNRLRDIHGNIVTSNIESAWNKAWDPVSGIVDDEMEWANKQLGWGISDLVWNLKWNDISSTWRSIWSNLSVPKIKLPHFSITGSFSISPPRIPKVSVKWYGEGGLPDIGELFVAREAGPELVGSIGGRTAVANNDQIVTAVSEGVAKAVSKVLGKGDSSGDLILKVNETEFGRISKSSINKYNRQTGEMAVEV